MTELFTGRRADEKIRGRGGVSVEFDCWTGLQIENKYFTIVEKINYKEKKSNDCWTEYGLVADPGKERWWLSVMDGGLHCTLSRSVSWVTPPKGYHLHDAGKQVVTGSWGDTRAAIGDISRYEQYKSADGTETFFVENNWGNKTASAGHKISATGIHFDVLASSPRRNAVCYYLKSSFYEAVSSVAIVFFIVISFIMLTDVIPNLSARDWHDFRRFVGTPYTLHERLSDAPYYTEQREEDGARVYTAQTDAATVALDLIEGVDGSVKDAYEDLGDAEQPLVLRTQTEMVRITNAADGTTRISLTAAAPDTASAADKLQRAHTLVRYAELVRTGDTRGRAGVVQ